MVAGRDKLPAASCTKKNPQLPAIASGSFFIRRQADIWVLLFQTP